MEECQEPRCTHPATKTWGGRKICQDHFETYREAEERMLRDMRDSY